MTSTTTISPDTVLRPSDVAAILNVTVKTLANWRSKGLGPTYTQFHGHTVRYLASDVEAYCRGNRVPSGGAR